MKSPEELMIRLMNHLADKYKNRLILKGGMLLRLLNAPRSTQDLDYSWIRTKKRSLFAKDLQGAVEELEGLRVTAIQANSRGVFLDVQDEATGQRTKIEINVETSTHLPPKPLNTAAISNLYSLKPRIVTTMDLAEAFSHKIAAAMERDLARDLYDLSQFEPLTRFDETTLRDRLSRLEIRRAKARKLTPKEAAHLLKKKIDDWNDEKLQTELSALLPSEYLPGLASIIRASITRLIQRMREMKD